MERTDTINDDKIADMLLGCLNEQATLKDIHNIPDDMMNSLYAYAYQFYQQGKLDNAETFFQFLCMYDFYNTDYFMGLAAVYQLKKQYQKAAIFTRWFLQLTAMIIEAYFMPDSVS